MCEVTDPLKGAHHDQAEGKGEVLVLRGLFSLGQHFVRAEVEALVQAALEPEMTEAIGAAKGARRSCSLPSFARRSKNCGLPN